MASLLLDRLRVKNSSTKQEVVGIIIKPPEKMDAVEITTKVVDMRDPDGFDRTGFLEELNMPVVKFRLPAIRVDEPDEPAIRVDEPDEPIPVVKKKLVIKKKPAAEPEVEPEVEPEAELATEPAAEPAAEPEVEPEVEPTAKPPKVLKIRKQKQKQPSPIGATRIIEDGLIQIGDTKLSDRIAPKKPAVLIKASSYYMDNRELFINFINSLFATYKQDLKAEATTASCESRNDDDFDLMSHQKIVRDYINLYTPYRGLLLYHGLGSGKTCSSIAIAEGMKDNRKIIVMMPASLKRNYFEELKKCGDSMYKKKPVLGVC